MAVTEEPGQYRLLRTRLGQRDGVDLALGFHPLRAGEASPHDLARFFRLLPQTTWVGEIGLDFSRAGLATRKQQLQLFDAILSDSLLRSVPVTVHSRGAERETISRLAEASVSAVLHWYTGLLGTIDEALAAGLWFSVNPATVRSRKALTVLQRLPPEHVLLETDGPFARLSNRAAVPADVIETLTSLARLWDAPLDHARAIIIANQQRLLDARQPR